MGRIVALDYGTKRTGVAVSDPLQIIATALETVPTHKLMDFLGRYVADNLVDLIVVGMPTQMNGQPSQSFVQIKPFVERLRKAMPTMEVVMYDERFTSMLAQRTILEAGARKTQRQDKALVDRVSATIILQSYMLSR